MTPRRINPSIHRAIVYRKICLDEQSNDHRGCLKKKKKTVINNVLLESSLSMNILGLRVKFACTRGFFSNFSSDNQQKYPSRMIEEGRDLSSHSSRIGIYTGGYSRSQKSSHCYLSLIRKIYPLQRQICFSKKNVPSNFHHSIHVFEKDFLQR